MNKNVLIAVGVIVVIIVALPLLIGIVRDEPLPPPPTIGLHAAALKGDTEEIRRHIAHGSPLDTKDGLGSTALNTAAAFGHLDAAKALVEAGVNLDLKNSEGNTALMTAAFLCHTELVQILLDNGADKNLKNNVGTTALDSVAGPFEEVKWIYELTVELLGPLGLRVDYAHVEATRPNIAAMLR